MITFTQYLAELAHMSPTPEQEVALKTRYLDPHYKKKDIIPPEQIPGGHVDKERNMFVPDRHLGIAREDMPQVENDPYLRWLIELGVHVERIQVVPRSLLDSNDPAFAQDGMDLDRLRKKLKKGTLMKNLILLSKDNKVLDGNHRWLSLMSVAPDKPAPMWKIGMNFDDLRRLTNHHFPGVTFAK